MKQEIAGERAESWWPMARKRCAGNRLPWRPSSVKWGSERGTPVSRHYVDEFVASHRRWIRGRVLEVKDRRYTDQFGDEVTVSDVLDIDASNPRATVVTDLASADSVPDESYDCFLLTETLQYIFELERAIGHAHRILRRGGVLLATAPSLSPLDSELGGVECWRFTPAAFERLFRPVFGEDNVEVSAYGNFAGCLAWLTGLATEDLPEGALAEKSDHFLQNVGVCARK